MIILPCYIQTFLFLTYLLRKKIYYRCKYWHYFPICSTIYSIPWRQLYLNQTRHHRYIIKWREEDKAQSVPDLLRTWINLLYRLHLFLANVATIGWFAILSSSSLVISFQIVHFPSSTFTKLVYYVHRYFITQLPVNLITFRHTCNWIGLHIYKGY